MMALRPFLCHLPAGAPDKDCQVPESDGNIFTLEEFYDSLQSGAGLSFILVLHSFFYRSGYLFTILSTLICFILRKNI